MEIPPGGIVVRLMPVVDQQLPSSLPPPLQLTSNLQKITLVNPNYLEVGNGEIFNPVNETKIYDNNSSNSSYKLWETYLPGYGKPMSESTNTLLLTKYVDVNEHHGGGRSSHKKYKKSSKRGRSMKRKSKKYSRRR
jgi:hypothetical protein